MLRGSLLLLLLGWSPLLLAGDHWLVLKSGTAYRGEAPYRLEGDRVVFTLQGGAEMSLPKAQVDFAATAARNGGKAPPPQPGNTQPPGEGEGFFAGAKDLFNRHLFQDRVYADSPVERLSSGALFVVLICWIGVHILCFWGLLQGMGEQVSITACLLWNVFGVLFSVLLASILWGLGFFVLFLAAMAGNPIILYALIGLGVIGQIYFYFAFMARMLAISKRAAFFATIFSSLISDGLLVGFLFLVEMIAPY